MAEDIFPRGTMPLGELKGKKVITPAGEDVGDINEVYINPQTLKIEGIKVGKGLFRTDYYVWAASIRSIDANGAVLSVIPLEEVVGMKTYDSAGREVGKVKEVVLDANNCVDSLVLERGVMQEDMTVDCSEVNSIGRNVLLNTEVPAET
jgi:sporulation protein YlmC with PRC-barrel domain